MNRHIFGTYNLWRVACKVLPSYLLLELNDKLNEVENKFNSNDVPLTKWLTSK